MCLGWAQQCVTLWSTGRGILACAIVKLLFLVSGPQTDALASGIWGFGHCLWAPPMSGLRHGYLGLVFRHLRVAGWTVRGYLHCSAATSFCRDLCRGGCFDIFYHQNLKTNIQPQREVSNDFHGVSIAVSNMEIATLHPLTCAWVGNFIGWFVCLGCNSLMISFHAPVPNNNKIMWHIWFHTPTCLSYSIKAPSQSPFIPTNWYKLHWNWLGRVVVDKSFRTGSRQLRHSSGSIAACWLRHHQTKANDIRNPHPWP